MNDLREKVENERSLLKKIELAIPGFRGYRKREDLRIADSMLRDYIARLLDSTNEYLKSVRETLSGNMALDEMNAIGRILNKMLAITEEVRHAEQGYMGLVGDYKVNSEELNRLYGFDLKIIGDANKLKDLASDMASTDDIMKLHSMMKDYEAMLNAFQRIWNERRDTMLGVFK